LNYSSELRKLSEGSGSRSTAVCYTSIFRRIRKIVPAIPDSHGKPVDCAAIML